MKNPPASLLPHLDHLDTPHGIRRIRHLRRQDFHLNLALQKVMRNPISLRLLMVQPEIRREKPVDMVKISRYLQAFIQVVQGVLPSTV